jgi:hypothetical protein
MGFILPKLHVEGTAVVEDPDLVAIELLIGKLAPWVTWDI